MTTTTTARPQGRPRKMPIEKECTYQRNMRRKLEKGDRSIAECHRCDRLYKRSASSNLCAHCRKGK